MILLREDLFTSVQLIFDVCLEFKYIFEAEATLKVGVKKYVLCPTEVVEATEDLFGETFRPSGSRSF